MTKDELLKRCQEAGKVGAVAHEEFVNFVIVMNQKKKVNDEWVMVQNPYLSVDGRLAMANEDHRRQGKKLHIGAPEVLENDDDHLTLMVEVESEIYGKRHGIAASRKVSGNAPEKEQPWEVAETSAVGRALGEFGYGLFPGNSTIATAEDMARAGVATRSSSNASDRGIPGGKSPISAVQRRKLTELYRNLHGGSEADAARGLDELFVEAFKHGMSEASYEQGAHITAQLLAAGRGAAGSASNPGTTEKKLEDFLPNKGVSPAVQTVRDLVEKQDGVPPDLEKLRKNVKIKLEGICDHDDDKCHRLVAHIFPKSEGHTGKLEVKELQVMSALLKVEKLQDGTWRPTNETTAFFSRILTEVEPLPF